jgi:hypothetical protein
MCGILAFWAEEGTDRRELQSEGLQRTARRSDCASLKVGMMFHFHMHPILSLRNKPPDRLNPSRLSQLSQ